MYYITIVILVGCAVFFYKAAEAEDESGFLWATLSVLISLATMFYFQWGWLGMLLAQFALFIGIGVFRAMRKD